MQIKRLVNSFLKRVWVIKHIIKAITGVCAGRWYVFRDTPLLVVRCVAMKKYIGDVSEMYELKRQAREELQLRKFRK